MSDERDAASIWERYAAAQEKIAEAASRAGRDSDDIHLLVVTKRQPLSVIKAAISAGIELMGENYPEEAVIKQQSLGVENKVEWHMIGHVQSRKARLVAENFALLHSLDSLKLARRLDSFCAEAGTTLSVLLQFNVGGELSKFGWDASDQAAWDAFLPDVEAILALKNLDVQGLMTMPPFFVDAELARPHFRQLRRLRDTLAVQYPQVKWKQLSMGTSGDFQIAVEEGATIVRLGQAVLGPRPV